GRELGLPEAFVGRHPFPGPGLAIRCPGEISSEKLEILRRADDIFIEEIRRAGLYNDIWQAFAVLLPVRTVGGMGDYRTYAYVVGLRAVSSTDGMTADFYPFDMQYIGHVATRIINEVRGVNRVVYDVTSKPPGTIEWEGPLRICEMMLSDWDRRGICDGRQVSTLIPCKSSPAPGCARVANSITRTVRFRS